MIRVKGFRYYNDNHCPTFEKEFENLGQLEYFIRNDTVGKSQVRFPAVDNEGNFDQKYAGTFSGCIEWIDERRFSDSDVASHITLIVEGNMILFSSGHHTDNKGHISKAVKAMIDDLKAWKKEEYIFAE